MKVELIAHTQIDMNRLGDIGYRVHAQSDHGDYSAISGDEEFYEANADELAEFAGRNCYRSFDRPNPKTRENKDYLAHILEVGHESIFEHSSASFYIEASRSVLTELERHRHLSFSVVSQRYVDATQLGYHYPPAMNELDEETFDRAKKVLQDTAARSDKAYDDLVYFFTEAGLPRKKAREAARAVLPNMTSSPMVVTGNHRAWRYVIKARWHEAADAEIRELAGELLRQLREIAPHCYQDVPDAPYSY